MTNDREVVAEKLPLIPPYVVSLTPTGEIAALTRAARHLRKARSWLFDTFMSVLADGDSIGN